MHGIQHPAAKSPCPSPQPPQTPTNPHTMAGGPAGKSTHDRPTPATACMQAGRPAPRHKHPHESALCPPPPPLTCMHACGTARHDGAARAHLLRHVGVQLLEQPVEVVLAARVEQRPARRVGRAIHQEGLQVVERLGHPQVRHLRQEAALCSRPGWGPGWGGGGGPAKGVRAAAAAAARGRDAGHAHEAPARPPGRNCRRETPPPYTMLVLRCNSSGTAAWRGTD